MRSLEGCTFHKQPPPAPGGLGNAGLNEQKATPGRRLASPRLPPPTPGEHKNAGPGHEDLPGAAVRPGPGPPPSRPDHGKAAGGLHRAARSQAPAAPTTRSGNGPRVPPPLCCWAACRAQVTRPLRASVSPSGAERPPGGGGARIWGHRPRCAPGGGPRLGALRRQPGRRRPGLSFPVGASSPQAEGESSHPPPRRGPHRQARHDLDRAAVAEVPSGLRRRLGHGHCRLLRAARPPRGARRRPFAAPLPADAPAHAHAKHARHARRGVESARERGRRRARQAPARATVVAEGQTGCGRLSRRAPGKGAEPGLGARWAGPRGAGSSLLGNPDRGAGVWLGARPGSEAARRPRGGACLGWGRAPPLLQNRQKLPLPSLCLPPQVPPLSPLTIFGGSGSRAHSHLRAFALAVPLPGAPQTPAWLSSSLFSRLCSNMSPTAMPFSIALIST